MASDMPDLTFIHTSFANLFCQNFVKKNRKSVPWVSTKDVDIWYEKKHALPKQQDRQEQKEKAVNLSASRNNGSRPLSYPAHETPLSSILLYHGLYSTKASIAS